MAHPLVVIASIASAVALVYAVFGRKSKKHPKRRVFYSFHFENDSWRASQVRNIGFVAGNKPTSDNDWEKLKQKGDAAVKGWIDQQMKGRSCTIVLVGSRTANRKWVKYEIEASWKKGMGVVGVYVDGLKAPNDTSSGRGKNPFDFVKLENGKKFSSVVKCHEPEGFDSNSQYEWISNNLSEIVEEAIEIRKNTDSSSP